MEKKTNRGNAGKGRTRKTTPRSTHGIAVSCPADCPVCTSPTEFQQMTVKIDYLVERVEKLDSRVGRLEESHAAIRTDIAAISTQVKHLTQAVSEHSEDLKHISAVSQELKTSGAFWDRGMVAIVSVASTILTAIIILGVQAVISHFVDKSHASTAPHNSSAVDVLDHVLPSPTLQ